MKNIFKYLIVGVLLFVIFISSAYTYRIDNKESFINTLDNTNIELNEEQTITFKAIKNNLNKIKFNIDYKKNYEDNQEVLITVKQDDKVIKEEKVRLNKLQTYHNILIKFDKIKDSIDKEYQITIKPLQDTINCKIITTDTMYYQSYHNILYISLMIVLTIITFILLKFLFKDKNIKIENWYLVLSIIVYGTYIIAFPLFAPHDEYYHWGRAYEISEGHLLSEVNDNYSMTKLPLAVSTLYNTEFTNIRYATTYNTKDIRINEWEKAMFDMRTVAVYSPVQYIPQSIGIAIARIFTSRTLVMAYFGRIMNAIMSIILMYLAIKLIPFGKKILFTIAFIPIAVEGFTSLSADAITISISFLLLAYILNLKFNKDIKTLTKKHHIYH